jgi:hypothetical protein
MVTIIGTVLACFILLAALFLLLWDEYATVIEAWFDDLFDFDLEDDDWFEDMNG